MLARKSKAKAAPEATKDEGFSREQLGEGGEFCCCLTVAEEVSGAVTVGQHEQPLAPSPLHVASQHSTSADRKAITVLL